MLSTYKIEEGIVSNFNELCNLLISFPYIRLEWTPESILLSALGTPFWRSMGTVSVVSGFASSGSQT